MIKRFLDGLAFGAGFGIAFSIVSIAVWMFLIPTLLSQASYQTPGPIVFDGDESPGRPMSSGGSTPRGAGATRLQWCAGIVRCRSRGRGRCS